MLAARTLGQRRVGRAASRLHELVTASGDPFLAAEALKSLLEIEDQGTLRALLDQLAADGPFMLADIAAQALKG